MDYFDYFGKHNWSTFERGTGKEWLVTNGLGGYASSTVICANTRKYHGLLVAASHSGGRILQLAKLDECFMAGGSVYNLATNCTGGCICDSGYIHLQRFALSPLPNFTYSFSDISVQKTIFMVYGENTTVILYRIVNGSSTGILRLTPMVNCRGYHHLTRSHQLDFTQNATDGGVELHGLEGVLPLYLTISQGNYQPSGCWYRNMYYQEEEKRGENCYEDHYMPGYFELTIAAGADITVAMFAADRALEYESAQDAGVLLEKEHSRLKELEERAGYTDPLARRLVRAADAFIVTLRPSGTKTIIAGYPWFTDWGRDTMIALPGLTLATKRYHDAKDILSTYAEQCKQGLLPNCMPDNPCDEPLYNTVDASLWFFQGVYQYLAYTGDHEFIRRDIFPVLKEIVRWYVQGTLYNIFMDQDGLLYAGTPEIQLTWMDAKVDDWVVTPRNGKPVEINALWYNSVCLLEDLTKRYGEKPVYFELSRLIKGSFLEKFWDEEKGYLCDVLTDTGPDWRVRPNQLLAVSLPYSLVDGTRARRLVRKVWRELYVTYGIRSLAPMEQGYQGSYAGDRVRRDSAYHQGTAWSWLIGPFVTAYRKAHNYDQVSREQAHRFLDPFRDHLRDRGLGQISEIFDGDEPLRSDGCYAQAWGVGEVLRVYIEDVLMERCGQYVPFE